VHDVQPLLGFVGFLDDDAEFGSELLVSSCSTCGVPIPVDTARCTNELILQPACLRAVRQCLDEGDDADCELVRARLHLFAPLIHGDPNCRRRSTADH
jgi:hypothetical protein